MAGLESKNKFFKSMDKSCVAKKSLFILLISGLFLTACAFQPLYRQDPTTGQATQDAFAQIQISPIKNREGQLLRNELRDRLNPYGQPRKPHYRLVVRVKENRQSVSTRSDGTSSRYNQRITVHYDLVDLQENEPVFQSVSFSANSYNAFTNEYSTLVTEETARKRNFSVIADDIRLKLGIYFARLKDQPGSNK